MPNKATEKTESALSKLQNSLTRNGRAYLLVGVVLLVLGFGALSHSDTHPCGVAYRNEVTIHVGSHQLAAQRANSDQQREDGLSGKACLGNDQAMLFTFDKPGTYKFWMKEMNFPIDMIWLSPDKKVVTVKSNVQPSTYPNTFTSTEPASYVIEVNAGRAAAIGLKTGSQVTF